ncbi:M48 family metallopeptidase [Guptibacillus hwajinpoensis]|uniref:M48 family metallopeptidase n=1 Tax=Guptibacillus hwajinpoensis TaxID=208199 RepID=UPI00373528BA
MPQFQFGTTTIEYSLNVNDEKKDVSIAVEWLEGVRVTAPTNLDTKQLETILHKKAPWIIEKIDGFNQIETFASEKEFLSGEKLPYLGRNYRLKVTREVDASPALTFHQGKFYLTVAADTQPCERIATAKELFQKWYISHGQQKIQQRLALYSPKLNLYPKKIEVRNQNTRWGSCTPGGNININWRIMMAPMNIVDYLVVHELAHLKHPNHSTEYWRLVESVLPDYKDRKEWLRINGPSLTI